MEIAFRTKVLRNLCLSAEAMDDRFGAIDGELLRRCLADMRAAECFGDISLLAWSLAPGGVGDEAVVNVGAGVTVFLKTNHQKPPKFSGGQIDWSRVNRILIHQIERAHG